MWTWPTKVFFIQGNVFSTCRGFTSQEMPLQGIRDGKYFCQEPPCDHVNLLVLFPFHHVFKWFLGFRLGEGIEALSEKSELVQALRKASSATEIMRFELRWVLLQPEHGRKILFHPRILLLPVLWLCSLLLLSFIIIIIMYYIHISDIYIYICI